MHSSTVQILFTNEARKSRHATTRDTRDESNSGDAARPLATCRERRRLIVAGGVSAGLAARGHQTKSLTDVSSHGGVIRARCSSAAIRHSHSVRLSLGGVTSFGRTHRRPPARVAGHAPPSLRARRVVSASAPPSRRP